MGMYTNELQLSSGSNPVHPTSAHPPSQVFFFHQAVSFLMIPCEQPIESYLQHRPEIRRREIDRLSLDKAASLLQQEMIQKQRDFAEEAQNHRQFTQTDFAHRLRLAVERFFDESIDAKELHNELEVARSAASELAEAIDITSQLLQDHIQHKRQFCLKPRPKPTLKVSPATGRLRSSASRRSRSPHRSSGDGFASAEVAAVICKSEEGSDVAQDVLGHIVVEATGEIARQIGGIYLPAGTRSGSPVFQSKSLNINCRIPTWLYFYKDEANSCDTGWWFGTEVDGDGVWAFNPSTEAQAPPHMGWQVLNDLSNDSLRVTFKNDDPSTRSSSIANGHS
eukprot:gnl/MRDRNA2_/MRDRNA2_292487_c0_seq1.p1 gnl/MRDRNA2_/MRDRNA2_292487_c0~~gnl/MRDRNA2_/MRDRNA2_292487_c0_seq1.p1  ORF type:complete len:337 (+),score=51.57 gnl/MRDRNA2_/MRDRNA2_292487_c0_seq1:107-1117(+)